MALVNILDVKILQSPCSGLQDPFRFEITFESTHPAPLPHDLQWKVIYVGNPETSVHDQVLEDVLVGPVEPGVQSFVLETAPVNAFALPKEDVLGLTIVLLTCLYANHEFIRVGYYVNNQYDDPALHENPPPSPIYELVRRQIVGEPRVTRFPVEWL
eukprot:gnl/Hemi2/2983_TR1050_c0_g1_i1.p1 gnl/Hemi2/2983_TR1050_c0_g1~~gnl/Hemi2/2983_TR1050_c0_g1_i1.p1  ORF type:complete len:157 (-),score=32.41 gnl/Hemi2/2983_TR1050_c0_g1_i1:374-844(-)